MLFQLSINYTITNFSYAKKYHRCFAFEYRLLPESVPWLAANNKIKEAEAILQRAEKWGLSPSASNVPQNTASNLPAGERLHERPVAEDAADEDVRTTESVNAVDNVITESSKRVNNNGIVGAGETVAPAAAVALGRGGGLRHGLRHAWSRVRWVCRGCKKGGGGGGGEHLKTQQTCFDLLRSKTMMLYTFIMCSLWSVGYAQYSRRHYSKIDSASSSTSATFSIYLK